MADRLKLGLVVLHTLHHGVEILGLQAHERPDDALDVRLWSEHCSHGNGASAGVAAAGDYIPGLWRRDRDRASPDADELGVGTAGEMGEW